MAEGNPIKYSDLIVDDGAITKAIKEIDKFEKKFKKTQESLRKEIEETRKSTTAFTDDTEDQEKELEKLEKQIEDLIKANKKLNETEEDLVEAKKRALKLAKQDAALKKKLIDLESEQAVEIERTKLEISEKNKLIKEQVKREKGLTNAYDDQSKRLNVLRRQYKALAVEGKANTVEAKKLLKVVTELDEELKEIDKSVGQAQRSVGDYKEQVKEALKETGLWAESMTSAIDTSGALGGVVSKLQGAISFLATTQKKLTERTEEGSSAVAIQDQNTKLATLSQRLYTRATTGSVKALKLLKNALIGSGIAGLVVILGSIVGVLAKTQAGLNGVDGVMRAFGAVLEVIVGRLITLFSALGASLSVASDTISRLSLKFTNFGLEVKKQIIEIKNFFGSYDKELKNVNSQIEKNELKIKGFTKEIDKNSKEAVEGFAKSFLDLGIAIDKAVDMALELSKKLDAIKLENSKISVEMAKQLAISEKAEEIEGDATRSFKERTAAILTSIQAQKKASELGIKTAENNLKAVNEELKIIEEQRELLTDEKIRRLEASKELIDAQKDFEIKSLQLTKTSNMLKQDEIEKNLDILIDGFDNQKTINERIFSDEKKRFEERRKLIVETSKLQQDVLKLEVAELQKGTKEKILIDELLKAKDAEELNRLIRKAETSEILEQRTLEVVKEAKTQEFELGQALIDIDLQRLELKKEINQALEDLLAQNIEDETNRAKKLQAIDEQRAIDEINIKQKLYQKESEEFQKLEDQKTQILKKGVEDRESIELAALDKEQTRDQKALELKRLKEGETQEEINKEKIELKIEQLKAEIELEKKYGRDSIDAELELEKLKQQQKIDTEKKTAEKIKDIQDKVADAAFDSFQQRVDREVGELDRLEAKQLDIISNQEQRANEGLENNVAFEEAQLAKLEQKKIQAQKKQIILDKTRALYNAYSAASASGDKNAIVTVLRDFAILNGIESSIASFGEGTGEHGTVEDSLSAGSNGSKKGNSIKNGVLRGESHKRRGFGIPILAEGKEGILSTKQMGNLGTENFVSLAKRLDSGVLGQDLFSREVGSLSSVNMVSMNMDGLTQEMKQTRKAIEDKPVQVVDVDRMSKNILDFVDQRKSKNKSVVNRYRVTKNRI